MKNGVSVPDDRKEPDWITERLNEVAESVDTSLDPFIAAASYEVLRHDR